MVEVTIKIIGKGPNFFIEKQNWDGHTDIAVFITSSPDFDVCDHCHYFGGCNILGSLKLLHVWRVYYFTVTIVHVLLYHEFYSEQR